MLLFENYDNYYSIVPELKTFADFTCLATVGRDDDANSLLLQLLSYFNCNTLFILLLFITPDDDLNPVKNPNDLDNTDVYGCLTTYFKKNNPLYYCSYYIPLLERKLFP